MNRTLSIATILGLAACGGTTTTVDSQPTTTVVLQPQAEPEESSSDGQPMQIADAPANHGTWDVYPPRPSETADRQLPPPIAVEPQGNEYRLLPEVFRVYVNGNTVINHPARGFQERVLPTVNDFRGAPGCYVACYSHDRAGGVYGVGGNIYVMGQVRVPGHYEGRVCLPDRFGHADISAASGIRQLCKASVPSCGNNCWGGGDTGGWFGIK